MLDRSLNDKRAEMPRSLRAKQFLPFAALKGFSEALYAKEKEHEAKTADEIVQNEMFSDDTENVENYY